MNEQFFHDRAKTVRELAERADPHTKRRLLDLAIRYEKKPRPPTPLPGVSSKDSSSKDAPAKDAPLTSTVGLVDMPVAPTLTSRLLADVVQGREKG